MPLERQTCVQTPFTRALTLPPRFRLVMLGEVGDAFARTYAARLAAGTLIFVRRLDLAKFDPHSRGPRG
jgi:hypothetical protein